MISWDRISVPDRELIGDLRAVVQVHGGGLRADLMRRAADRIEQLASPGSSDTAGDPRDRLEDRGFVGHAEPETWKVIGDWLADPAPKVPGLRIQADRSSGAVEVTMRCEFDGNKLASVIQLEPHLIRNSGRDGERYANDQLNKAHGLLVDLMRSRVRAIL